MDIIKHIQTRVAEYVLRTEAGYEALANATAEIVWLMQCYSKICDYLLLLAFQSFGVIMFQLYLWLLTLSSVLEPSMLKLISPLFVKRVFRKQLLIRIVPSDHQTADILTIPLTISLPISQNQTEAA